MKKFKLRDYQKDDMKLYLKHAKKHKHILYGGTTGYGKSAIIYNLVKKQVKKGNVTLIILPRRKLVKQISETLSVFAPSIIMGSDTTYDEHASVFVASTSTLHNKLKKYGKKYLGDLGLVIIDEAHINHLSTSMSLVMKHYWDDARWCGLSATPIDNKGYRLEGYDYTMYHHQAQSLIELGWLSPIKVMVEDTPKGLSDVSMTGGDYNEGELSNFMSDDARVKNVYAMWSKYCIERKTIIFAVSIPHANIIYQDFLNHNIPTGVVHSDIHEDHEEETLHQFKHGELKVLINVGKLTTGYDEPSINAMIMARPTKSLRLWLQCIGRGLRLYKGKKDCLLLDLAGTVEQHGYPTMKRDFNKVKPKPKEKSEITFKELVCPHCDYSTQYRNCRKEVEETEHYIAKRTYCPNCELLINEDVVETKEIERLKLVKDYTNTSKVTDQMVGELVVKMQEKRGYQHSWVNYVADAYNKDDSFKESVKLLYNRHEAGLINIDTATTNLMKLKNALDL